MVVEQLPLDARPAVVVGQALTPEAGSRAGMTLRVSLEDLLADAQHCLSALALGPGPRELYQQLVDKEEVIQNLLMYRRSSLHYWLFDRFPGMWGPRGWPSWTCFERAKHSPLKLRVGGEVPPPERPLTLALVTPSFQQAPFLQATLRSVQDQRYPWLDYFVQDGGSRDGSVGILRDWPGGLRWESRPDQGQTQAINRAFQNVQGEVMGWLNSDDLLLPGALNYIARFFLEHPEIDVVYGHRVMIDREGREIGRWVMPPHRDDILSWGDLIPQETLFWRRQLWERVGGLDETFQFAMDWDLLLRFRDAGARFALLPRFLGGFRVHRAQKTSSTLLTVGRREMDRLRLRSLGRKVSDAEIFEATVSYYRRAKLEHLLYRLGLRRIE